MPQLARWRMRLQDHDFTIRFLSGALNATADGLSRTHVDDVEVSLADAMPECSLLNAQPSTTDDLASVSAIEIAPYVLRSASRDAAQPSHQPIADDADGVSDSDMLQNRAVPRSLRQEVFHGVGHSGRSPHCGSGHY